MSLKLTCQSADQQESLTKELLSLSEKEISVSKTAHENGKFTSFLTIEPSLFRQINSLVKEDKQARFEGVAIEIVEASKEEEPT